MDLSDSIMTAANSVLGDLPVIDIDEIERGAATRWPPQSSQAALDARRRRHQEDEAEVGEHVVRRPAARAAPVPKLPPPTAPPIASHRGPGSQASTLTNMTTHHIGTPSSMNNERSQAPPLTHTTFPDR